MLAIINFISLLLSPLLQYFLPLLECVVISYAESMEFCIFERSNQDFYKTHGILSNFINFP